MTPVAHIAIETIRDYLGLVRAAHLAIDDVVLLVGGAFKHDLVEVEEAAPASRHNVQVPRTYRVSAGALRRL